MLKMPAARTRRIRGIITLVSFLALIALVVGLRKQIFATLVGLGDANAFALMLVIVWQALNFHSQAHLYMSFFEILGVRVKYPFMLRTALELNFVNAVFPSGGVSGFSYLGLKMRSIGVSPGTTTLVQMMRFIAIFVSFQIFLFTGLLLLALSNQASNLTVLIAGSLATLLVLLTVGMVFIIGSKKRINAFFTFIASFVNRVIHMVRPSHPETISVVKVQELFTELHENFIVLKKDLKALKKPLIFAFNANLGEVLTIYSVFVAFDQFVNPGAVIIAYAVANFAGLISVLPGGIGIYEGLMTAVLASAGISPAISLPVIITFRVLNVFLQLPAGYFFYYRTLHPKNAEPLPKPKHENQNRPL